MNGCVAEHISVDNLKVPPMSIVAQSIRGLSVLGCSRAQLRELLLVPSCHMYIPEARTRSCDSGTRSGDNGTRSDDNGSRSDDNGSRSDDNGSRSGNNGTRSDHNDKAGLARFSHPGKYLAVNTGKYRPEKNLK